MAIPFGKDAILYHADALMDGSNISTAVWTEYDNVRDVTGEYSAETVDVTTRATAKNGWSATAAVLNNGEVSLNIPEPDPAAADPIFDAIRTAWLEQGEVPLSVMNGDRTVSGKEGLTANFSVSMSLGQPLKDVQSWDVTLTVSSFPEWYIAA